MRARTIAMSIILIVAPISISRAADENAEATIPAPSVRIFATPSILPTGARCRVYLKVGDEQAAESDGSFVEGTIVAAKERTVTLQLTARGAYMQHGTPILSQIPFVSRYFKRTGVGVQNVEMPEQMEIAIERISSIDLMELPKGSTKTDIEKSSTQ